MEEEEEYKVDKKRLKHKRESSWSEKQVVPTTLKGKEVVIDFS